MSHSRKEDKIVVSTIETYLLSSFIYHISCNVQPTPDVVLKMFESLFYEKGGTANVVSFNFIHEKVFFSAKKTHIHVIYMLVKMFVTQVITLSNNN